MLNKHLFKFRSCVLLFILFFLTASSRICAETVDSNKKINNYNVILIVITALRADHLGFNGYTRDTSPNIDKLVQGGIFFTNAISQSYWTLPVIASILTSKFVSAHKIDSRDKKITDKDVTLASILKAYDYKTAAFTCGLDLISSYGFDKGFDIYYDDTGKETLGSFSGTMGRAIHWLNKNKRKKLFLFLQSYDVHPPYRGPYENKFDSFYKGGVDNFILDYSFLRKIKIGNILLKGNDINLGEKDIDHIIAHYDGGIRYADEFIGQLTNEIKRMKLDDKTIIILCSDHGEELGERGSFNRFGNQNLYQEVIRSPLIIKYPAGFLSGRKVDSLAQLVDIAPTILNILGIPVSHAMQGRSLLPLITTGEGNSNNIFVNEYAFSEASHDKWAVINKDGYKLIYSSGRRELYNLKKDPAEQSNLSSVHLDIQEKLMKEFFSWRKLIEQSTPGERIKLSDEMIKKLRRAGYWQ